MEEWMIPSSEFTGEPLTGVSLSSASGPSVAQVHHSWLPRVSLLVAQAALSSARVNLGPGVGVDRQGLECGDLLLLCFFPLSCSPPSLIPPFSLPYPPLCSGLNPLKL